MRFPRKLATAALGLSLATAAFAQDIDPAIKVAIDARQAQMTLYSASLVTLGAMAKGDIAYNAEVAEGAATNLFLLTQLRIGGFWPEGSDNMSVDSTRALPDLWDNLADVRGKGVALFDAAQDMNTVAGDGLEALQGAIGPLGKACAACHKAYRAPEE